MNANYSEALEQQARLTRLTSPSSRMVAALDEYAGLESKGLAAQVAHASLLNAETFYWPSDFCRLLSGVANDLPSWTLHQDALPASSGFWWFAECLPLPFWDGQDNRLRAISWISTRPPTKIRLVFWIDEPRASIGPWPTELVDWEIGSSQEQASAYVAEHATVRSHDRLRQKFQLFAAGLAFLQQRVAIAPQLEIERHARRRLERDGWLGSSTVRVVRLRRAEVASNAIATVSAPDWACQWVVRGHWRQQFYPSRHANQPIWITPYVKGPEDKPLKPPRATVFAVVR